MMAILERPPTYMVVNQQLYEIFKRVVEQQDAEDAWRRNLFSPAGLAMIVPSNKRRK
jgi:hypothetical protein